MCIRDRIKADNKGVAMVFAAVSGGKVTFLVSLTDDLVEPVSYTHLMKIINSYMDELKAEGSKTLDGEKAFKLHDLSIIHI